MTRPAATLLISYVLLGSLFALCDAHASDIKIKSLRSPKATADSGVSVPVVFLLENTGSLSVTNIIASVKIIHSSSGNVVYKKSVTLNKILPHSDYTVQMFDYWIPTFVGVHEIMIEYKTLDEIIPLKNSKIFMIDVRNGQLNILGKHSSLYLNGEKNGAPSQDPPSITFTITDCIFQSGTKKYNHVDCDFENIPSSWTQVTCVLMLENKETGYAGWMPLFGSNKSFRAALEYGEQSDMVYGCGPHTASVKCFNAKYNSSQATESYQSDFTLQFNCTNCCTGGNRTSGLACSDNCKTLTPPQNFQCNTSQCACELVDSLKIPNDPPNFIATALSHKKIKLSWQDSSFNVKYYEIERKISGGTFVNIVTLPQYLRWFGYTDSIGLDPETNYEYRIRATNAGGQSGWVTANATTLRHPFFTSLILNNKEELIYDLTSLFITYDNWGSFLRRYASYQDGYSEAPAKALVDKWKVAPPQDLDNAYEAMRRYVLLENALKYSISDDTSSTINPGAKEMARETVAAFVSGIGNLLSAVEIKKEIGELYKQKLISKEAFDLIKELADDVITINVDLIDMCEGLLPANTDLDLAKMGFDIAVGNLNCGTVNEDVINKIVDAAQPYLRDRLLTSFYIPRTQQHITNYAQQTELFHYLGAYPQAEQRVKFHTDRMSTETTDLSNRFAMYEQVCKSLNMVNDIFQLMNNFDVLQLLQQGIAVKTKLALATFQATTGFGTSATRFAYLTAPYYNPILGSYSVLADKACMASFDPVNNFTGYDSTKMNFAQANSSTAVSIDSSVIHADRLFLTTLSQKTLQTDTTYLALHGQDIKDKSKLVSSELDSLISPLYGINQVKLTSDSVLSADYYYLFGLSSFISARRSNLSYYALYYRLSTLQENQTKLLSEIDTLQTLYTSFLSKLSGFISNHQSDITDAALNISPPKIRKMTDDIYRLSFTITNVGGRDITSARLSIQLSADSVNLLSASTINLPQLLIGQNCDVNFDAVLRASDVVNGFVKMKIDTTRFFNQSISFVLPKNRSLYFSSAAHDTTIDENQYLKLSFSASQADNKLLTFSANNLPVGAAFNKVDSLKAEFVWTPTYDQSGNYSNITIKVSDGTLADSLRFNITVRNVNRAPSAFTLIYPIVKDTVNVSTPPNDVSFSWNTSIDPDKEDTVKYQFHLIGSGVDLTQEKLLSTSLTLPIKSTLQYPKVYRWSIVASDGQLFVKDSSTFNTSSKAVSVEQVNSPLSFYLGQNYPNPFTSTTTIDLTPTLSSQERVSEGRVRSLKVYDVFGREILDLSNKIIFNGQVSIDNSQLPSQGIYFYRLMIGGESQTRMMMLIK